MARQQLQMAYKTSYTSKKQTHTTNKLIRKQKIWSGTGCWASMRLIMSGKQINSNMNTFDILMGWHFFGKVRYNWLSWIGWAKLQTFTF